MADAYQGADACDANAFQGACDANAMEFDLSKKKKKKKVRIEAPKQCANYTYEELLQRVMDQVRSNNPELVDKKRLTIKPPVLKRVATTKTIWINFADTCSALDRNPEHVFQFFMAELGTEGSIDGQRRLVIRGKLIDAYVESLLKKYIAEYVTCKMCRSANTTMTKDSVSRLHFLNCQDCGSSRSVAPIRTGFHAKTRADRKASRKTA